MIDELFNEMCLRDLVDWGVVMLGVAGVPGISERLTLAAFSSFLNGELEKMAIDDPLLGLVVELTANDIYLSGELRDNLEVICRAKGVDLVKSSKKWRAISLENILSNIAADSVYGLIELSEFWAAWGWPNDSPTSMQKYNNLSPQDFHSPENYEYVVKNHREWLVAEFASLR